MVNWQELYRQKICELGYKEDADQIAIVDIFARIDIELTQRKELVAANSNKLNFNFFQKKNNQQIQNIKGLYCHGGAGRGKTFLMDLFCQNTQHSVKRIHYYRLMKEIHDKLKLIKDQANPIDLVAKEIVVGIEVLCIDEFFVIDITDAMILHNLLSSLIKLNIIIVTTSNVAPDDLFKNGLQRARFLPAIDLIKQNLQIFYTASTQDFRLLCLVSAEMFYSPHDKVALEHLHKLFNELSHDLHCEKNAEIEIYSRKIKFIAKSAEVIWFDFANLCATNRSQLDYLWLADNFHSVILSDIPELDKLKEDAARRFLMLVDELYDKRIALILSSAKPIDEIYVGQKMVFEFSRLKSRLHEMLSTDYLS